MGNSKIYVKNLSFNTTENELKNMCEQFGQVYEVKIVRDHDTDRSRGFGFVTFATVNEAEHAIRSMNNELLDGRVLNVAEAVNKRKEFTQINS